MSERSEDVVYSVLFDERVGRMPATGVLSARDAAGRWESGMPFSVLPAHTDGEVVPWSITARGGRDYVVNRYVPDGRRTRSVRWEQTGGLLRRAGGAAWFAPEAGSARPVGAAYEIRWRTYDDGSTRIETIGPTAGDDDVVVLRTAGDRLQDERPAPEFASVADLRHADGADTTPAAVSDPRAVAAEYVSALASGATLRHPDEVFGAASHRHGSVILATAGQIAEMVDRIRRDGAPSVATTTSQVAVLRRGPAIIVPLGAQGSVPSHWSSIAAELRDLSNDIRAAFEFRAGQGVPLDLASAGDDGYRGALVAAGATRATVWREGTGPAVLLVAAGDPDAGTCTMSLHVVPASWVSPHPPAEAAAAVAWSWFEISAAS